MSKDLHFFVEAAQELEELLVVAFGPLGRAVMVQQPSGQFTITRSGYNILTSVFSDPDPKNPARQILLNSASRIHASMGDGVKSFIIMTSSLLKTCESLGNATQITRQLSLLQIKLNELQFSQLELPVDDGAFLEERIDCFERIIQTFFFTRFPAAVANVLAPLLCQWILSNAGNSSETKAQAYSHHTLNKLLQCFPLLCHHEDGGSRAVSESCVQHGYRVHRQAINLSTSHLCKIEILLLGDGDSPGSGCFDDLDVQAEVDRFLSNFDNGGCKDAYSKDEKILLVTSAILSDLTLFRLRCSNVAVLHGVLSEDVRYIHSVVYDFKKSDSRGAIINVRVKGDATWLELPNIHQLLLRAPTTELCTEYATSCLSALRLCIAANSHVDTTNALPYTFEAGGYFERALRNQLAIKGNKNLCDPAVCGVRNRAELLAWHEKRRVVLQQNLQLCAVHSNLFTNDQNTTDYIKHRRDTQIRKEDSINKNFLHSMRNMSLSKVPNFNNLTPKLSDNNGNKIIRSIADIFMDLDESVVETVVKSLLEIQRQLPESGSYPGTMKQQSAIDPLGLKLSILQHSLGATISLLRVSGVIQTKKNVAFMKL